MESNVPNSTPTSIEEMTGVIELIAGLDRKRLASAVRQRWVDAEMKDPGDNVEAWLEHLMAQMKSVPTKPGTEGIIIGYPCCEQDFDDPHRMDIHMTSSLFHVKDLPSYDQSLMDSKESAWSEPPVNGYAYEICDWEEILSWRTWVPESTTELERCEFAADLIWELTFFGDTYEGSSKRSEEFRDSLDQSAAEYERWKKEGTIDEHTHSLDDLRERWNLPKPDPLKVELERQMADRMWRLNELMLRDFVEDLKTLSQSLGLSD